MLHGCHHCDGVEVHGQNFLYNVHAVDSKDVLSAVVCGQQIDAEGVGEVASSGEGRAQDACVFVAFVGTEELAGSIHLPNWAASLMLANLLTRKPPCDRRWVVAR